jgi:hypothetical protein
MLRVGFETTIPVFERANTFHVLDRAATVIGFIIVQSTQSWLKHNMCLRVLHVRAYCGRHQVHRAFTITLLSICYTSLTLNSVYTLGVR